jgi:hypothetical protein
MGFRECWFAAVASYASSNIALRNSVIDGSSWAFLAVGKKARPETAHSFEVTGNVWRQSPFWRRSILPRWSSRWSATRSAGGQAVVGAVDTGGGVASENQRQPHAKAISYAPVAPLWSENPEREPVPLARDAERSLPHARGEVAGST